MKRTVYMFVYASGALQAGITIDNRSAYPFIIHSITYEEPNGQHIVPQIESALVSIEPGQITKIGEMRRNIIGFSGNHNNMQYTFTVKSGGAGVMLITPENRIESAGQVSLDEKSRYARKTSKYFGVQFI